MISRGVFSFLTPAQWRDMNSEKFQQLLPCALILKGKYSADNEFQKVKARLVVLGNLQRAKYGDMFAKASNESPTVSLTSLFSILVLAAKKKLKIASFDVAGAFLHADLEDSIYMKLSKQIAAVLMANNPDTYEKNFTGRRVNDSSPKEMPVWSQRITEEVVRACQTCDVSSRVSLRK